MHSSTSGLAVVKLSVAARERYASAIPLGSQPAMYANSTKRTAWQQSATLMGGDDPGGGGQAPSQ
jgi:hypothetical protein